MSSGSKFYIYGVGQVVNDIDGSDTWEIDVYLLEKIPTTEGTIGSESNTTKEFKDKSGKSYSYLVNSSNVIKATWLPFGNYNRATAPCVCKGEYVLLFKYDGEDMCYWIPLFMQADRRKKETAVWFFSNKTSTGTQEELQDQGYMFKIDTINQQIQLHTDDSQDESCGYDFTIDTSSGIFLIEDTIGNSIELDSTGGILSITLDKDLKLELGNNLEANVKKKVDIQLDKLSIKNNTAELIETLSDLIQAIIDEQHIGNLGVPTKLQPDSAAKFVQLKAKIDSFKG